MNWIDVEEHVILTAIFLPIAIAFTVLSFVFPECQYPFSLGAGIAAAIALIGAIGLLTTIAEGRDRERNK